MRFGPLPGGLDPSERRLHRRHNFLPRTVVAHRTAWCRVTEGGDPPTATRHGPPVPPAFGKRATRTHGLDEGATADTIAYGPAPACIPPLANRHAHVERRTSALTRPPRPVCFHSLRLNVGRCHRAVRHSRILALPPKTSCDLRRSQHEHRAKLPTKHRAHEAISRARVPFADKS